MATKQYPNRKTYKNKPFDKAAKRAMNAAKKIAVPVNDNIFPGLSPERHRLALIESCINTDEIFTDKISDPPDKGSNDIRNYMFYNQLFFLASAQMLQPDATGSLLPGIVGGLSMIAAAAVMNDGFRKHLKEHAQDSLLKYVEPFKESTPKLWQKLSAQVESHPGCVSPESIALKLMRYQRQAYDMVNSGDCDAKFADDLLLKKTSELKAAADEMNINWADVIKMRNTMAKDMESLQNDRMELYGENWQQRSVDEMEMVSPGLSGKVGNARDWKETNDFVPPVDTDTVAIRLKVYQKELQEAVEELNSKQDGEPISSKYAHLAGKSESEYFAAYIKQVAGLKAYTESVLGASWDEVADKYDKINRAEYDVHNDKLSSIEKYVDEKNRERFMPDGSENPDFGKPNDAYYEDLKAYKELKKSGADVEKMPKVGADGKITDYANAYDAIDAHNRSMYYELPVDSESAGRCLKKYQQEAYGCVRGMNDTVHEMSDSSKAYTLANDMCRNVRAAADILKFNWQDSIKAYRKDVYTTVLKNPGKSAIWSEMVNGDVITNIPKTCTTYRTDSNGRTKKEVRPLDPKEQINAWDGAMFKSDGSRVNDNTLMHIRNPYTEEEASKALYNLFVSDFKLQLQEASIVEKHSQSDGDGKTKIEPKYQRKIDAINDEREGIKKRRDELLNAFTSDHFSPDLIDRVEMTAMKWFEEAKMQMSGKKPMDKGTGLDENLLSDDVPALPDKSGPSFN